MKNFFLILLCTLAVAFLAWWLPGELSAFSSDDSYIYFSFARNIAEGNGYVFFPGGERVEGGTSLGWTLICTALYLLPGDLVLWLRMFSVLITALFLHLVLKIISGFSKNPDNGFTDPLLWIYLFSILCCPGFIQWMCLNGLDTPLWAVFIAGITWLSLGRMKGHAFSKAAILLFFFFPLARPESLLWGALLFLSLFFASRLAGKPLLATIKENFPIILAFTFGSVLLIVFRLMYFGYPFPNTYYAKVGGFSTGAVYSGLHYLKDFIFSAPILGFCLVVIAVTIYFILMGLRKRITLSIQPVSAFFLLCVAGFTLMLPVLSGGDHFRGFRFFQPLIPFFLSPVFLLPDRIRSTYAARFFNWMIIMAVIILLIPLAVIPWKQSWIDHTFTKGEWDLADESFTSGATLSEMFRGYGKPFVSTGTVGGFEWGYDGPVLDIFGLTSTVMAHSPGERTAPKNHSAFDKAIFYSEKPDMLTIRKATGVSDTLLPDRGAGFNETAFTLTQGITQEREFKNIYQPAILIHPSGKPMYKAWYRNEFIDKLRAAGYTVFLIP